MKSPCGFVNENTERWSFLFPGNSLNHGKANQKRVLVRFIFSDCGINIATNIFSVDHRAVGNSSLNQKLMLKFYFRDK